MPLNRSSEPLRQEPTNCMPSSQSCTCRWRRSSCCQFRCRRRCSVRPLRRAAAFRPWPDCSGRNRASPGWARRRPCPKASPAARFRESCFACHWFRPPTGRRRFRCRRRCRSLGCRRRPGHRSRTGRSVRNNRVAAGTEVRKTVRPVETGHRGFIRFGVVVIERDGDAGQRSFAAGWIRRVVVGRVGTGLAEDVSADAARLAAGVPGGDRRGRNRGTAADRCAVNTGNLVDSRGAGAAKRIADPILRIRAAWIAGIAEVAGRGDRRQKLSRLEPFQSQIGSHLSDLRVRRRRPSNRSLRDLRKNTNGFPKGGFRGLPDLTGSRPKNKSSCRLGHTHTLPVAHSPRFAPP